MAYYVIYGADKFYGGSNGCRKYDLISAKDYLEAEECAKELSEEVIDEYSDIHEVLQDQVTEAAIDEDIDSQCGGQALEDLRQEIYDADRLYDVWELNPTNLTLDILKGKLRKDPSEFIEEYCEEQRNLILRVLNKTLLQLKYEAHWSTLVQCRTPLTY